MNEMNKAQLLSHLTVAAVALAVAAFAGCGGFGRPGLPTPERWILAVAAGLEILVVAYMWQRWGRERRSPGEGGASDDA